MKTVALPGGERVPALGMGTWKMGDSKARRAEELATLRLGIELGATLIDTAEMYGEGASETLVGEAVKGRREEIFLVSKVYPHNASRKGAVAACERSLERLGTDRLDLYLLHWRGSIPLAETIEAFEALKNAGKIRHWGVSNLDPSDMQELAALPQGSYVQTDQVLYNLTRRGIEWDLLPWLRKHRIPVMAYSPIEEGRLALDSRIASFAKRNGMTPAQVALAWVLRQDGVIAIPKSSRRENVKANMEALKIEFSAGQLKELDAIFPPPNAARALEMI